MNKAQKTVGRTAGVDTALIDQWLAEHYEQPSDILGKEGLLARLTKAVVERALGAELTHHLGYAHGGAPAAVGGNCRNGTSAKTLVGEDGAVTIAVPRDRHSTFEPRLIPKGQTRFAGFDEKIIALYARGMTVRDIQGLLLDQYHVDVGHDFISTVTDAVLAEVVEWQSRPLERLYPLVFFDALRVKIRSDGVVKNQAVYLAGGGGGRDTRCAGAVDRANRGGEVLAESDERTAEPGGGRCVDCRGGWPEGLSRGDHRGVPADDGADLHRASDAIQLGVLLVAGSAASRRGAQEHLSGGQCRGGRTAVGRVRGQRLGPEVSDDRGELAAALVGSDSVFRLPAGDPQGDLHDQCD